MKSKRIMAGVAAATIAVPIVGQAIDNSPNNLNIKDEVMLADQSLPIEINTNAPVITKRGNVYEGTRNNTVPATSVATNSPNVTNGVSVTYAIPISIHSTNGKKFNIPNLVVSANPVVTYDGPQTPEKTAIANEIAKQIKTEMYTGKGLNSTYSGKPSITINVGDVDWGMTIQPNITVKCGNQIIPIKVPDLKTTTKYSTTISSHVPETIPANGIVPVQIKIQPNTSNYYYNSTNKQVKSVSFKASISGDNGRLVLNPAFANNSDVHFNASTGECTLTGSLASGQKYNDLFKIESVDPSKLTDVTVNIQPNAITYQTENGDDAGSKVNGLINTVYQGSHPNYTGLPNAGEVGHSDIQVQNICSVNGGGQTIPTVNSTSTITISKNDLSNWNVLGISYLPKGKIVTKVGNNWTLNKNGVYFQFTAKQLNILATGTPKEKDNMINALIEGQGIPTGAVFGSQIESGQSQEPAGGYNAVIYGLTPTGNGKYTGSTTYQAMPDQKNPNGTLLSKTIVFANPINSANNSITTNEISGMNDATDMVTSANGKVTSIFAGNNNLISTDTVSDGGTVRGFWNGQGQSSTVRTGEISHDSASNTFNSGIGTSLWIDNSNQDKTYNSSWLNNTHTIEAKVYTPNIGGWGNYTSNSKITFDMHTSEFSITGLVRINNTVIPQKDIEVNGNIVTINIPKGTMYSAGDSFYLPVKYTNPEASKAGVTFSVTGKEPGTSGVSYSINNKQMDVEQVFNKTFEPSTLQQNITFSPANGCVHSTSGVDANNNATMNAIVQNASSNTVNYLNIIPLPGNENSSLPSNEGQASQGGLSAKLTSIDNPDCPIYVLPKSALDTTATAGGITTNAQAISATNPFDMAGMKSQIESGKTGWIKYTPGMDLSNIAAIAAMPTVKPHSIWKLNYGVKLKGVQNGAYQYTTSEFKYFDTTDGVGSLSNVVSLAPKGVDLNQMWNSSAVVYQNGSTRALTKAELAKTVTFTNSLTGKTQTEPLSYIFSHGNLIDANYDITPGTPEDHLQQNVDLVNAQASLAKAGFKLIKTTVKVGNSGADTVDKNFFTNTGVMTNTQFTKVVFTLEQITPKVSDTVTVQVKNADGTYSNVVVGGDGYQAAKGTNPGTQAQAGQEGDANKGPSDVKTPVIPAGYKIDGVIVKTENSDGSWTTTTEPATFKVPTTLGATNAHYIYQISKEPAKPVHDTVSVTVNGKTVNPGAPGYVAPQTGKEGTPVTGNSNVTTPKIPDGYQITGVTVITHNIDGTTTKTQEPATYKVPGKLGKTNTDYIYNITKKVQDTLTVKVKQKDGTYKEVSVGQPGYVAPQKGTAGLPEKGDSGIKNPTIPAGYKIDSIYLNGKEVASTPAEVKALIAKIPSKLGKEDANYVYNISPIVGSLTTQVVVEGADGKVISNDPATQAQKTVQGQDGTTPEGTAIDSKEANTITIGKTTVNLASSDASATLQKLGYKLVKTTIATPKNPTATNTTPAQAGKGSIEDGATHIVYTLQKNVPVTVKVVTVDAKGNAVPASEQVPAKTTNGVVVNDKDATPVQSGSATDVINSTDSGIVVPKGYHVAAKNTVNGKDIKVITTTKDGQTIANIPASEIGKDGSNIVYTITKDAPITKGVTVKVVTVDANGNPVPTKEQVPTTTVSGIKVTDVAGHVQTGLPTDKIDSTDSGIVVPKGYHVAAKNTLNGKDIKVTTT
ncbi:MAG: hypothetical protein ACRCWG_02570, partial [Sarcina sp.]